MAKLFPLGLQTFEQVANGNYYYVDKTALVHRLVHQVRFAFLSRPRRFGKSLLVSTLHAYFNGERDKFNGLAMEALEADWIKYPVLHVDFNNEEYKSADELRQVILAYIADWERIYGCEQHDATLGRRFASVIKRACEQTGQPVVVLVDEYDKPLVANIGNEPLQDELRSVLKAFYGTLKTCDRYIHFAFLTGVTHFSKVSVFSDLNQMTDLSMARDYNAICGITQQELEANFSSNIQALAKANDMSMSQASEELRRWYDGYRFHPCGERIYNPYSIINALAFNEFNDYWFESGTPTWLIKMLHDGGYDLTRLAEGSVLADGSAMRSFDDARNMVAALYQTGYITIKGYDRDSRIYRLGYPNNEVAQGFTRGLLPLFTKVDQNRVVDLRARIAHAALTGDVDTLMRTLQSVLAMAPAATGDEHAIELNYRNVIWLCCFLSGLDVLMEHPVAGGVIDLVMKTPRFIYVMEFKRTGLQQAVRQMRDRHYADAYVALGRKVIALAVSLSDRTKNIEAWQVVPTED